jgi:malate dehydrogenase (oxaloacetate-decarboxylating)
MRYKLTAKDAMSSPVASIESNKSVFDAAKLMKQKNIGTIVITIHKRPVGIATEKDIVQRLVAEGKDPQKVEIGQIMTAPLMVASPNSDLNEIAKKIEEARKNR